EKAHFFGEEPGWSACIYWLRLLKKRLFQTFRRFMNIILPFVAGRSNELQSFFNQSKRAKKTPAPSTMYPNMYPLKIKKKQKYPINTATYILSSNVCVPPSTGSEPSMKVLNQTRSPPRAGFLVSGLPVFAPRLLPKSRANALPSADAFKSTAL
ncbi:hypothetical protein, partial [Pseudomonas cannabina]|uniref:hypothetical protein n=1 Tax=Pseudomonas cannabina TaxID=86840 RepID=UPI001C3F2CF9